MAEESSGEEEAVEDDSQGFVLRAQMAGSAIHRKWATYSKRAEAGSVGKVRINVG